MEMWPLANKASLAQLQTTKVTGDYLLKYLKSLDI